MVPEQHLTASPGFEEFSRRYQALLHTAELASRRGLPDLLQELAKRLREVFDFNFLNYALYQPATNVMRLYALDEEFRVTEHPIELSIDNSPAGWAWSNESPLVIEDLENETKFSMALDLYKARGLHSVIVLPMATAHARLGTLSFGSVRPFRFDSETVHFLDRITGLVGLAIENWLNKEALTREEEHLKTLTTISLQLSERSSQAYKELQEERQRLEVVLEINAALAASKQELRQMFPSISRSLAKVVPHDTAIVGPWDEEQRSFELYSVGPVHLPEFTGHEAPTKTEVGLTELILSRVERGQIIPRAELEAESVRFVRARKALEAGLVSWCVAPIRTANRLVGVLYLGSRNEQAFAEKDLEFVKQVATGVALSIENAQTYVAVQREKNRLQMVFEISRALISSLEPKKLFSEISRCIRQVVAQDYTYLALYDEAAGLMRIHALDFPAGHGLAASEAALRAAEAPAGITFRGGHARVFSQADLEHIGSEFTKALLSEGIRSVCCFPLFSRGRAVGTLDIGSKKENAFTQDEIEFLSQVAPQVAVAVDNSRAFGEIASLKDKLTKEKLYLEQEIRDVLNFEEIVGQSPALAHVLDQVKTVAPSDATVLILGETGTGKELIARAIHRLSSRHNGNFVKLNCAAIPTGLLESELFGHEKGAFTGAISQKVGRLEVADKGTLLLDEVGEIPLELQPKLLRVLQDHEFERLGGNRTIRVNVRLLAATNRDLSQAVSRHEFRSDLFYRLNVFPVRMPPLRERGGDIPLLVRYFVQKFARRMNKQIDNISAEAMRALENWYWPGNIRELENFMERSVILTEKETLRVPIGELRSVSDSSRDTDLHPLDPEIDFAQGTLEDLEREYILQVLRQTHGVIAGSRGAAARLGMKRTTLQSKMQRLGIKRTEFET
jgi:formate hydrogenlyase transcriptional activator